MKKTTHIYHAVSFEQDKFDLLYFWGCNFDCKGCIRHCGHWDHNLPQEAIERLKKLNPPQIFLSRDVFTKITKNLKNSVVFLGGGEASLDPLLPWIAYRLKKSGFYTVLQTNGHFISAELLDCISKGMISEVRISLKAISPNLYHFLTGQSIDNMLDNMVCLDELGVKLRIHTTFIPDLISTNEIRKIAKFISDINPDLTLTIDSYVAVPDMPWQTPSKKSLEKATEITKKYLRNVSYAKGLKGQATLVYP